MNDTAKKTIPQKRLVDAPLLSKNPMKPKTKQTLIAWIFMLPALILLITFVFFPIIGSLVITVFNIKPLPLKQMLEQMEFIGLDNFRRAFGDANFLAAIKNSVLFVLIVPVIQLLSILMAMLVNRKLKGIKIFRTIYYIPVITSMVAVSMIWARLFGETGLINNVLMDMGILDTPYLFLSDGKFALAWIGVITLWQGIGYYMMLYLAGFQSIPAELCEAAYIDGASNFQTFIKVKLPLLKPYIVFCTFTSIISAVGVFDLVYILTQGGPVNATMVMGYYSYFNGFIKWDYDYSAAVGSVQALLTFAISIAMLLSGRKKGGKKNGQ